jgi:hypothetical protein
MVSRYLLSVSAPPCCKVTIVCQGCYNDATKSATGQPGRANKDSSKKEQEKQCQHGNIRSFRMSSEWQYFNVQKRTTFSFQNLNEEHRGVLISRKLRIAARGENPECLEVQVLYVWMTMYGINR